MNDRTSVRIELLRIAFSQHRDDTRALNTAKEWEPWVLEFEPAEDKPAKPGAKPKDAQTRA